MTIISFRQLPPENKAVNLHCFKAPLERVKAVNLNGRMFWFYLFDPLDVHEFNNADVHHEWSF